jgi:peroxiredoxin
MRLTSGQQAVAFTATTIDGETISLARFAGKPVLLMFFRYASCPMCNLRLHDLAQRYGDLHEQGLEVLALFHSSSESIRAHAGARRYPFRLIPDPKLEVYRRYGVETSWLRLLLSAARPRFYVDWVRSMWHGFWGGVAWQMGKMPADFLIAPDGRIAVAHYGADIGDHLPLAKVDAFLRDLTRTATISRDEPSRLEHEAQASDASLGFRKL